MYMQAIVCADRNWGIGKNGELLVHIPEDMRRFRAATLGKTVIVGRKTLSTFPGGRPLAKRTNIILSGFGGLEIDGAQVVSSVGEALRRVEGLPAGDVFVIGGQQVYKEFLPYCTRAYVTRLNAAFNADRFFPALDRSKEWRLAERSSLRRYGEFEFYYETFEKI
jgi:dihydrofolate reductase